jgi:peptidoglycan/xylan/chitin deacetylase (PgdA/CDA1 family)
VYLEKQAGFPYENIPMIRNTASVGTAALLSQPFFREQTPAGEDGPETAGGVFTHGRRRGQREIALCFDLYDDDTGLSQAMEALNSFGVRATFFLNGEFIRRHPDAARSIAESGHEAASMFYAPIDLSSSRYQVSGDFIAKGLARNEDEYYQASGGELALLWHTPFYRVSGEITAAASRAGYLTIGRDVDPMDWISRDDALKFGISRASAPLMIENIMDAKEPGSIIPIRLGQQPGRNDYLFLNLETLLDALIRGGYSIVPVSVLVHHGL